MGASGGRGHIERVALEERQKAPVLGEHFYTIDSGQQ